MLVALASFVCVTGFALTTNSFVSDKSFGRDSFPVVASGKAATIVVDTNDWPGVIRVAKDLQADIKRVSGVDALLAHESSQAAKQTILIGTIGRSALIDRLVSEKKIDVSDVAGKWEAALIQVVEKPLPGVDCALVIAGSDKRGTIYGVYEISEQMGVSPWHYWADVTPEHKGALFVAAGRYVQSSPSVKYRGIFLNDEAPSLTGWVREKFGEVPGHAGSANYGRGFYTNLFELILRIRGNYLWPAMWNNAFNEDDLENPRLADEYGIVMGTSHQEPMLRAQKEWDRSRQRKHGNWNYNNTNQQPVLQEFWRDGVRRNKNFENIITMGLRAENDSGAELGKNLTETVINVQRKILAKEINPDLTRVPQLWCLYKEVMGYYNEGLRVPDDVTLLWAEDNWGNIRRLPTADERHRSGGAGVYYHFDYHGGPRSYQWINTSPIPKIWEQMSLAKQYGADRIWIVNVGHFKGYEFPMEYFMSLAWNTDRWTNENLDDYTRRWAEREFGATYAKEIAEIISAYSKFNGRRKPELLDANTYSLVNYDEAEKVVGEYQSLSQKANVLNRQMPRAKRAAFYQLVEFPANVCARLNQIYVAAGMNALYAKQGRTSALEAAFTVQSLFVAQTNAMDQFNRVFAGGKWNHFMDQAHIGYVDWRDPAQNSLRAITLIENNAPEPAAMGVAVEGSTLAWPAETNTTATLPQFDIFNDQEHYIEVFNKGVIPFNFSAAADSIWIKLGNTNGTANLKDARLFVSVDWNKAPKGTSKGTVKITGVDTEVSVKVEAFNPTEVTRETLHGFIEGEGFVSIEAEHFTKKSDAGENRWIKIPGYGHTLSAMRSTSPLDVVATPGKDSPCLEYRAYYFTTGSVDVATTVGATLNFAPGRGLRYAVSFDDEPPQTVTIVPANFNAGNGNHDWEESVKNNCRKLKSTHTLAKPGYHTLKIWMIDPAVVLEKIVVDCGGVRPSYLGPPESYREN